MYGYIQPGQVRHDDINISASADIVAAVAGKRIRVLNMTIMAATATTVTFQSGASTSITGAYPLGANGGMVLPDSSLGWFETAVGEKLNIVLGTAADVDGSITYCEV